VTRKEILHKKGLRKVKGSFVSGWQEWQVCRQPGAMRQTLVSISILNAIWNHHSIFKVTDEKVYSEDKVPDVESHQQPRTDEPLSAFLLHSYRMNICLRISLFSLGQKLSYPGILTIFWGHWTERILWGDKTDHWEIVFTHKTLSWRRKKMPQMKHYEKSTHSLATIFF
jgi:hypothetical protein